MPFIPLLVCLLFLSFALVNALQASRDYRRRKGLPYPPGPRPLPLIGNLLDIPAEFSWLLYTQLAKKYGTPSALFKVCHARRRFAGDVMSFHILGRVVVILGSTKATKDLLEKRGAIYSDRPVIPFFEMCAIGFRKNLLILRLIKGFQDGCPMESTICEIWRILASSAQNCRTELSSCIPGNLSCPTRDESPCPRYSPTAESAGVDSTH
jgi:hypothetical protein